MLVTIFHHPYNWLEANNARAFRKALESISDVILTGHEHDSSFELRERKLGERNQYIEGGALQDSANSGSAFNALLLDVAQRKQKFFQLQWDESKLKYVVVSQQPSDDFSEEGTAAAEEWEDFLGNRLRKRGEFELNTASQSFLSEPGATLHHSVRGELVLDDIFVFPDLRQVVYKTEANPHFVPGRLVLELVENKPHLLISGDEQSGKTSLAKMLFKALHDAGRIPVYLDGNAKLPAGERLYAYIEAQFSKQYSRAALESYKQFDRARRVVLLDNYHRLPMSSAHKA